jgi:hypothetical protein
LNKESIVSEYEKHQQFYQQFNTVVHNHQEWMNTPEGLLDIIKDPWKRQAPEVRIDHPGEINKAREILAKLREKHK